MSAWQFFAGLGFFLYGMNTLETVFKHGSGKSVRLFLRKYTSNPFRSVLSGVVITGIMQSSSVVSLIVLVFVESGLVTFKNALAVIFGANLGTTISSWIVATVGFKLELTAYALPVIAIAAPGIFFTDHRKSLQQLFTVLFSLGILFLGLDLMKEGALQLVAGLDLRLLAGFGNYMFVVAGLLLTTVIQSSSATVAIALTALYAHAITLPQAASVVIGSEVGTTVKVLLWGIAGSVNKRRVGYGNFIYNIVTAIIAFGLMNILLNAIIKYTSFNDPLLDLVCFQSTINLIALSLFIPFLNYFTSWLTRHITGSGEQLTSYITPNLPVLGVLAPEAIGMEAAKLFEKVRAYINEQLCPVTQDTNGMLDNIRALTHRHVPVTEEYSRLKLTEGDLLRYYTRLQQNPVSSSDSEEMFRYIHAARQSVFAAKAVKDITHNLDAIRSGADDVQMSHETFIGADWRDFDARLSVLIDSATDFISTESEVAYAHEIEQEQKAKVISALRDMQLSEMDASSLLNVYKELYGCKQFLLAAASELGHYARSNKKKVEG